MMKVVGRVFKIVVLLLVVTAVTTILITPSPSDDVPGVMHRPHSHGLALAVVTGLLQTASLTRSSHLSQDPSTHPLQVSNFLELHCQHIC